MYPYISITVLEKFISDELEKTAKPLTSTERGVLRGTLENQTYEQMAQNLDRTYNYISVNVGPRLWKKISAALGGVKINRRNAKREMEKAYRDRTAGAHPDGSRVIIELLDPPDPTILNDILHILTQKAGLKWKINHLES